MNGVLDVNKIFICHWTKLVDRKDNLIKHLNKRGISDYEWVELYDKENWDVDEVKKDYPLIFDSVKHGKLLKLSEISLVLKHCFILKEIVNKNYESVLVLEDDVLLCNDFINDFNLYKKQLPDDWDLGWVGTCCDLVGSTKDGMNVCKSLGTRCTHAYIVSNNGAKKITTFLSSVDDAADWFYNRLIIELNLNNYWFEPALAIQNKKYETTIQN